MTFNIKRHPDMLRRFVAAPFVFNLIVGRKKILVESNDIEIALNLRRYVSSSLNRCDPILSLRVIRDECFSEAPDDTLIIDDDSLRTLSAGKTILTYDKNRLEVTGFLASKISAEQFIRSMLFVLIEQKT
jgi:hypothetical protein